MKKKSFLLSYLLVLGGFNAYCQSLQNIIFDEDFVVVPTGQSLPSGWVQYNQDGLQLNGSIVNSSFFGANGWVSASEQAVSTSHVLPTGSTVDDWLITPAISLTSSSHNCEFTMRNEGASKFKVLISNTGNSVSDFIGAPLLNITSSITSSDEILYTIPIPSTYSNQTVYLAFVNTSNQGAFLFFDNLKVYKTQSDLVDLKSVSFEKYSLANTNVPLKCKVKNIGSNTINNLLVSWSDGTNHNYQFNSPFEPGEVVTITHPDNLSSNIVGEKEIITTVTQVNNMVVTNPLDNTDTSYYYTLSSVPIKRVVFEEGTGTWCQYCPLGAVAMTQLQNEYSSNFIGIAVHNNDPMMVTAYNSGANFEAFPNANIDRFYLSQGISGSLYPMLDDRLNDLVPAEIDVIPSVNGSSLSFNVSTIFKTNSLHSNFNMGVILVEDDVHGTTAAYNQANIFANNAQGPMGGFENLPNPVPASQMTYNHVGRALLGGYNGLSGSVPATFTDGQIVTHNFTFTLPSYINVNNLNAVAVLIDANTGEIINSIEKDITTAQISEIQPDFDFNIFPNPTSELINIEATNLIGLSNVTIYNLDGKIFLEKQIGFYDSGYETITISDLPSGVYYLTVTQGSNTSIKQFVKE